MVSTPQELNESLADIRKALDGKVGAERLATVEKTLDDFKAEVRRLNELRAAEKTAEFKPQGKDAEIEAYYCPGTEDEERIKTAQILGKGGKWQNVARGGNLPGTFIKTEDGCVQMTGRWDSNEKYYEPGLLDDPHPKTEWQEELQEMVDTRSLVKAHGVRHTHGLDRRIMRHLRLGPGVIGKVFSDGSGIGAEWIPDITFPMMHRFLTAARRVEALFMNITVGPMGDFVWPTTTAGLTPYIQGVASADDPARFRASSITTSSVSFTPKRFAARSQMDIDAASDAVVAVAPILRSEHVMAQVDGVEDAIINSDTAATHQDSALSDWNPRSRWDSTYLGLSDDHRKPFIGLRARAFDVSCTTDQSADAGLSAFREDRSALDSPHGVAGDIVTITSPEDYLTNILAITQVLTVDAYGPNAVILTGEVAQVMGSPIIISEFVTSDLQATGLFTTTGGTYTGRLTVNRQRFYNFLRAGPMIRTADDITRGVTDFVSTRRYTFGTPDASTKKNVHFAFKI